MNARDRLNTAVNVAILLTLAIVLLNPRGVVGSRVAEWRSARQVQARIAERWDDLAGSESSGLGGPTASPYRIIEFIDYQCPSCKEVAGEVEAAAGGDVRVVIRHLPLPVGPHSRASAKAAICAEEQGRFEEMHETLFGIDWRQAGEEVDWLEVARQAAIPSTDEFAACLGSERVERRLAHDRQLADALGIEGTPTFVTPSGVLSGGTMVAAAFAAARKADRR